jgi:hypothetical protein
LLRAVSCIAFLAVIKGRPTTEFLHYGMMTEFVRLLDFRESAEDEMHKQIEARWQSLQVGRVSNGKAFMATLLVDLDDIPCEPQAERRLVVRETTLPPFSRIASFFHP